MLKQFVKFTAGSFIMVLFGSIAHAKSKGAWISWEDQKGHIRHSKILSATITRGDQPTDQSQSGNGTIEEVRENPGFLYPLGIQDQYFEVIKEKIDQANQDHFQASLNDDGSVTLFSPSTPGQSYLAARRFHVNSNLDALCLSYGFGLSLDGSLKTRGVSRANGYQMGVNLISADGVISVIQSSAFRYIERLDCSGKMTPPISNRYDSLIEKSGHTIIKKPKFLIHNQEYYFDGTETSPEAICKLYGFQTFHDLEEYQNTVWNLGGLYYQLFRKTARLYENGQFKSVSAGAGIKWIACE